MLTFILIRRANEHYRNEIRTQEVVTSLVDKVDKTFIAARPEDYRWPGGMIERTLPASGRVRNPLIWSLAIMLPLVYAAVQFAVVATGDFKDLYDGGYSLLNYLLVFLHIILMFWVLHFLTQDMNSHDSGWSEYARQVRVSLARAGFAAGGLDTGRLLERRSTAVYIILSIVTVGVFVVYWWYSIVKDQSDHLKKQAHFESELLKLVESQAKRAS